MSAFCTSIYCFSHPFHPNLFSFVHCSSIGYFVGCTSSLTPVDKETVFSPKKHETRMLIDQLIVCSFQMNIVLVHHAHASS
jgi:hypothetical protein